MERKATDILLSIEEKVNILLKQQENLTFQNTLILNKLQLEVKSVALTPEKNDKTIEKQEEFVFTSVDEEKSIKTRTIRQQVLYPKPINQPVINSNIKIYDENKKLINQKIRTTPSGHWSTKVPAPGKIFVHITKAEQGSKPKIDKYFEVDVTEGVDVMELDTIN